MPAKMYAVVLADGTSQEFKTKSKCIAYGETTGQAFTVLSPRGFEVHVQEAPKPAAPKHADRPALPNEQPEEEPEPESILVAAEEVLVGSVIIGARVRDKIRVASRIRVGTKFVTFFSTDETGRETDFLYVAKGTMVKVVKVGVAE